MNWIKLTPETQLPDNREVLARIYNGLVYIYKIGFVVSNQIFLEDEDEEMEKDITHYALIEEPADVVKEPLREMTKEDIANLPFDTL